MPTSVSPTYNQVTITGGSGITPTTINLDRAGPQGPAGDPAQPRTSNLKISGHSYMDDDGVSLNGNQSSFIS